MPDYGLPLWNIDNISNTNSFHAFEIAYHGALKRVVGVSAMYSNHDVVDYCNQFLFKHYLLLLQCRFFKRIMKSSNRLIKICLPFLMEGNLKISMNSVLNNKYDVDFDTNDLDIIQARISWVQKHELCTGVRL